MYVCVGVGGIKDMKTGEECTEEVVQCHYKSVCPVLAEEDLEGWVLLWVLGERESCMCVCVCVHIHVHVHVHYVSWHIDIFCLSR